MASLNHAEEDDRAGSLTQHCPSWRLAMRLHMAGRRVSPRPSRSASPPRPALPVQDASQSGPAETARRRSSIRSPSARRAVLRRASRVSRCWLTSAHTNPTLEKAWSRRTGHHLTSNRHALSETSLVPGLRLQAPSTHWRDHRARGRACTSYSPPPPARPGRTASCFSAIAPVRCQQACTLASHACASRRASASPSEPAHPHHTVRPMCYQGQDPRARAPDTP